jgi:hypothetical protein
MKQRSKRQTEWIECLNVGIFAVIASLAGKGQIFENVCTTFRKGNDMFDREWIRRISLLRMAVFATTFGAFYHEGALPR